MRLFDEHGTSYDVPDDAVRLAPRSTREGELRTLIVDAVASAVEAQRITTTVLPHKMPVNFGTDEKPQIVYVECKAQAEAPYTIVEPINADAVASTIMTRLAEHGFLKEDTSEAEAPQSDHAGEASKASRNDARGRGAASADDLAAV